MYASRITTPRIEIAVAAHGTGAEITVRDNGPGIAPDLLGRIGEPFATTKAAQGGMGLGLYVSQVLAEKMDGVLRVDSGTGGTRVVLTLPGGKQS
jgi:C4-dicarboxylate-specific signal transduction histidine kinase